MGRRPYGTIDEYRRALAVVLGEDMPPKRLEILRLHYEAVDHTATAIELAAKVGYKHFGGVNFQYGALAHAVASRLGLVEPPKGFWLYVLVEWADDRPPSGHTAFVVRPQVVAALKTLGVPWAV